ncbi:MAG: DUF1549 and DUF1553 domain-containing protein [Roseibacillus sp.]|nr:DUF1549 and DUF1553 domain-containing protein [Roseibacillus sp.]
MIGGLLSLVVPVSANPEAEEHWAWSKLAGPVLPDLVGGQAHTPVDHFIFARMAEAGVQPAPKAAPRELLRRVHLDLTGLPPTPGEVEAFLRDPGDEAYTRVVDDLLRRPQYGERWGRHWLDVVRYAESKGYERDEYKKFVWRYRDYVIESFNQDKPYDQFIHEQLAGDELDNVTLETQLATTFLALGTFDTIAADREVAVYDTLDDILATTSMAFLGQTLQCARCHDHKFEPFSQKDYYRVLAAFEPLNVTGRERQVGTTEDRKRYQEAEESYRRDTLEPRRRAEEQFWLSILKRWSKDGLPEGRKAKLNDKQLTLTIEAIPLAPDKRSKEHRNMLEKERNRVRSAVREVATEEERSKISEYEQGLKAVEKDRPQPMMGWVYAGNARPKPTHLRVRGEVHQRGEEIPFGVPVVLEGEGLPELRPTGQSSGRRRALAEWITGPQAPLAARVMANRVWQYHFGRGLVEDGNNLGMEGGEPTHPELLEWLASSLIEGGWRLKPLHRQIVLSSTYRLSATHPDPGKDPNNTLYSRWPLHRLEAEAIRDSILAASGKLNREMKGPPIYPPFADKVVGASSGADWKNSTEEEASRRSVYVFAKRAIPLPELAVLDNPDSSCSCAKRTVSTTAVQSLLMMNGRFINEQTVHLANRLRELEGEVARIRTAFELILCRPPTTREVEQARAFLVKAAREQKIDPLASLALVLFNTNEFSYR